jgi:hypothetical protein
MTTTHTNFRNNHHNLNHQNINYRNNNPNLLTQPQPNVPAPRNVGIHI